VNTWILQIIKLWSGLAPTVPPPLSSSWSPSVVYGSSIDITKKSVIRLPTGKKKSYKITVLPSLYRQKIIWSKRWFEWTI